MKERFLIVFGTLVLYTAVLMSFSLMPDLFEDRRGLYGGLMLLMTMILAMVLTPKPLKVEVIRFPPDKIKVGDKDRIIELCRWGMVKGKGEKQIAYSREKNYSICVFTLENGKTVTFRGGSVRELIKLKQLPKEIAGIDVSLLRLMLVRNSEGGGLSGLILDHFVTEWT